MKNWILPKSDEKPEAPKFPTSDFTHDMAALVADGKKKKKKKAKGKVLDGVDLEV